MWHTNEGMGWWILGVPQGVAVFSVDAGSAAGTDGAPAGLNNLTLLDGGDCDGGCTQAQVEGVCGDGILSAKKMEECDRFDYIFRLDLCDVQHDLDGDRGNK